MSSIKRFFRYLFLDKKKFLDSVIKHFNCLFPDKLYLSLRYRLQLGSWINWKNPISFTEKIQWLKIYGFKKNYSELVDKLSVKSYVANKIGSQYVIPLLNVWDGFDDIDWDSLPNQFVLKTTHGGGNGGVVICRDKNCFNKIEAKKKLASSMKTNAGKTYREKPYINIPKKIIAETFISDSSGRELDDYKFFCFNGNPMFCQLIRNRSIKETIDFYDMQWTHMPFVGLNPNVENGCEAALKPKNFDKMIEICKELSMGIPFVRVDLYNVHGQIYFGELTFYPASGFGSFRPNEWNNKLGDLLNLPLK